MVTAEGLRTERAQPEGLRTVKKVSRNREALFVAPS
jgi:hypothetical protein